LGAALRNLAGDAELWERMARRGETRAQSFSWENAVQQTWDVYRKLL
jgi:glycosyltransferase involved in cell wall biosynthesis